MRASYANANECFDISLTMVDKLGGMAFGYFRLDEESRRVLYAAIKQRQAKQRLIKSLTRAPSVTSRSMHQITVSTTFSELPTLNPRETTTKMVAAQSNSPDADQAPTTNTTTITTTASTLVKATRRTPRRLFRNLETPQPPRAKFLHDEMASTATTESDEADKEFQEDTDADVDESPGAKTSETLSPEPLDTQEEFRVRVAMKERDEMIGNSGTESRRTIEEEERLVGSIAWRKARVPTIVKEHGYGPGSSNTSQVGPVGPQFPALSLPQQHGDKDAGS